MKTSLIIISGLAGLALATVAFAQDTTQPPAGGPGPHGFGPGPHGPPPPVLAILDSNKDGKLSKEEIGAAGGALGALDANKDGVLTMEEICAALPMPERVNSADCPMPGGHKGPGKGFGKGPGPGPGGFFMRFLDTDGDGKLSSSELENASVGLLKLDKNSDGEITPDELRPPHFGRGPGPGGPPPAEEPPAPQQ